MTSRTRRAALAILASIALPATLGSQTSAALSLELNVPAFRLDVFAHDSLVETFKVAVGMPRYRTPRGDYVITSIEWNPWWIPPKSAWAKNEKITPPGAANPMGAVKLYFQPLYFLHGTPLVQSLGSAASHGCVRMRNTDALRLARLVYHAADASASDSSMDEWARDTMMTTRVDLAPVVPIRIRYDVVEVRRDSVLFHRDIYGVTGSPTYTATLSALQRAGMDTSLVDSIAVVRVVRRARRAPLRIALDSLVKQP